MAAASPHAHKTIAEFRRCNTEALRRAGAEFVRFCAEVGLIKGQWVAVDGTKLQAVASGKAVLEPEQLAELQAKPEQRIGQYPQKLETADAQPGEGDVDPQALRRLQHQHTELSQADPQRRHVLGEPESVVLKGKGPGHNVQTAVDAGHALIVAHEVNAQAGGNDCQQRLDELAQHALGVAELKLVADAGYANGEQAQALEDQGVQVHVPIKRSVDNQGGGVLFDRICFTYDEQTDAYVCPAGQLLKRLQINHRDKAVTYAAKRSDCGACPMRPRCTTSARRMITRHLFERTLQRIHQRATAELMRLRRCTVEHQFAAMKFHIIEQPRLSLRGMLGAATEIVLATPVYNLKGAMAVLGGQTLILRLAT